MKNLFIFSAIGLLVLFLLPSSGLAQISSGIATYVTIDEENIQEGDIIKFTPEGYKKTSQEYDPSVFGVVAEKPSVSFETTSIAGKKPVISSGKVYVRVTAAQGNIEVGNLITTSNTPGVGQKATTNGFVLGTAAETYAPSDKNQIGKILVVLNITYNASLSSKSDSIFATFKQAANAPYLSPLNALRYVFAGALLILSFIIAVGFFGKVSNTGVEAIGRNPLASKMIMFSVVLHLLLASGIIGIGVFVAYFILTI